jgi:hypothetical protein
MGAAASDGWAKRAAAAAAALPTRKSRRDVRALVIVAAP